MFSLNKMGDLQGVVEHTYNPGGRVHLQFKVSLATY